MKNRKRNPTPHYKKKNESFAIEALKQRKKMKDETQKNQRVWQK